jgi:dephospho-CoA kinase
VAELLRCLGAVVIDADAIVHELQRRGTPLLARMVEGFGPEILRPDGELDRKALGDRVFRDPEARALLGRIVHPAVGVEMMRRVEAARAAGAPLVVLDVPLLLEGREAGRPEDRQAGRPEDRQAGRPEDRQAGRAGPYDCVVVVWVPEPVQIERTMARDGCTRDEAERRVRAQMPLDRKRELADHVIDNSGTREETQARVRALFAELSAAAAAAP